ncbi:hypothetical protein [Streptococcus sanguinis]|uniref:Uncharacterized protein n=1 Tax=Streptococcus sanguinis TaxID=1305 RepID=A0AAE8KAS7_STRSA|nr:hypothetical protein [Streptococcus sanguinis]RSI10067.1 hypothetical protein D8888_03930 [Streptococcus sanguinis]RSI14039.1 hypothetical protein D8886_10745 [Streptococcus sanguinis]
MKKKIIFALAVLMLLIPGGIFGMTKWIEHKNSPYNVSDVLDDKGVKLYKRGFRLLEEQLATYIKEHYSGVSKIEFSPIFVQGGDGQSMFRATIVPVIYDNHGNKAYLGRSVGEEDFGRFTSSGSIQLNFDAHDNEIIEIKSDDGYFNISNSEKLPEKAKLSTSKRIDNNISALIKAGHIKDIEKNENGSPNAKVKFNTQIRKGDHFKWR